jgi:hypothetical protein
LINMEMIYKYKALLVIALILVAGFFFLFFRFFQNDVMVLTGFSAAYTKFDQAISDFSTPVFTPNLSGAPATDDLERKADAALAELNTQASARISSLTKNDAELMGIMLQISDLSVKELDALKAYKKAAAGKNAGLDPLAKTFGDLTNQRKTAYVRFQELLGSKD